ncbi:hypothetical protein MBOU_34690 [Mycobacterium bourgelatii]|uniref:Uncharacterized protein n=1 Tax=Mycobacterium bourgelatii TaxID=1273442 RepID=A0A7I9YSA4_MYCBU|nr:hypothetical protein MBOU_34690 [Mycobacterium bourgelatii]
MHPEISGDLIESDAVITAAGNAHDVVAELAGIGSGHNDILPARPNGASQLKCHLFVQQTRAITDHAAT